MYSMLLLCFFVYLFLLFCHRIAVNRMLFWSTLFTIVNLILKRIWISWYFNPGTIDTFSPAGLRSKSISCLIITCIMGGATIVDMLGLIESDCFLLVLV